MLVAMPAAAKPAGLNDRLLEALLQASNVPGKSAAIIKDGQLVWQGNASDPDATGSGRAIGGPSGFARASMTGSPMMLSVIDEPFLVAGNSPTGATSAMPLP